MIEIMAWELLQEHWEYNVGELKRLRKENRSLDRKIERMNEAYERLLRKRNLMIHENSVTETKFIAEVKLWRDKYDLVKRLYTNLKEK